MDIADITVLFQQCYNSHVMESAQVSVNKCMNADNAVCMHNGALFSH